MIQEKSSNEVREAEIEHIDIDSINQPIRWSPEIGESEITGVLEKVEMLENYGKPFPVYYVKKHDGCVYTISGYTVLRQKMEGIADGTRVKIIYQGKSEKSGALMFKVGIHPDDAKSLSIR